MSRHLVMPEGCVCYETDALPTALKRLGCDEWAGSGAMLSGRRLHSPPRPARGGLLYSNARTHLSIRGLV
eukprot:1189876-Prorocentrum_minimum.AAC.6